MIVRKNRSALQIPLRSCPSLGWCWMNTIQLALPGCVTRSVCQTQFFSKKGIVFIFVVFTLNHGFRYSGTVLSLMYYKHPQIANESVMSFSVYRRGALPCRPKWEKPGCHVSNVGGGTQHHLINAFHILPPVFSIPISSFHCLSL